MISMAEEEKSQLEKQMIDCKQKLSECELELKQEKLEN